MSSLFSKAYCCMAESNCRRLLMQALACDMPRAFTKLGIAIPASKPIMETTIMISSNVNPDLLDTLFFMSLILQIGAPVKIRPTTILSPEKPGTMSR